MSEELGKHYEPKQLEAKWYRYWERRGFFQAGPGNRAKAPAVKGVKGVKGGKGGSYCIVIPPPNITGRLHMGHALNNSLQDVLIRWKRMCGFNTLWLPGTDHAGIATQNRVEKDLREQGLDRREMGREAFVKRVWEWREEYGNIIISQLREMGCSCDWTRTRFTLDPGLSRAVRAVFKRLYDEGLIYRGSYMVNWCPKDQTALSDDEVEYQEVRGHLWHIRYPLEEGVTVRRKKQTGDLRLEATRNCGLGIADCGLRKVQGWRTTEKIENTQFPTRDPQLENPQSAIPNPQSFPPDSGLQPTASEEVNYITVATTRPETMLGDTAVAFHPEDERYQHLRGKHCILPLMNRRIPFIADAHVDRAFGTGMVKVTPAHDPNDYDIGKRHNLEMINILHPNGRINENGGPYEDLDRFDARERVVEDLKKLGLLEKVEDHVHQVGHSYRSNAIIEPYISEQWFISMKPLVGQAIKVVEDGRVRFVPESWENTYFHWMRNVRDWCISRQLWWGHQIPVWYCHTCAHITVSDSETIARCEKCGSTNIHQDQDVLDTWFSSALWPFSTMGWPDQTPDLAAYYPTSALLTAHEIIFFWVARMIIMGLKFMGDVPFRDVYIHPMVFDEDTRKKMSKSLGNIIDPLEMVEKYGSDALRMTVCAYTVKGSNLYLSEQRFDGYQNFMNKFWNSARFVLMNVEDLTAEDVARQLDETALEIEDRWILGALADAMARINASLENYEFDQYVQHLYHFIWDEYCDWYLEMVKGRLYTKDKPNAAEMAAGRRNAQIVLVGVLEYLCRLMQPVAPFITEEVWQNLRGRFGGAGGEGQSGRAKKAGAPSGGTDSGARSGRTHSGARSGGAHAGARSGGAHAGALGLVDSLAAESLMVAPWPDIALLPVAGAEDKAKMELLMEAIRGIRKIRSEMGVQPGQTVDVALSGPQPADLEFLRTQARHFETLARAGSLVFAAAETTGRGKTTDGRESSGGREGSGGRKSLASTAVAGSVTISVALPAEMVQAERQRLAKELEKLEALLDRTRKKLENPDFASRAPAQVVQTERDRLETGERQRAVLRDKLKQLG